MPKFLFHLTHSAETRDEEGVDLANLHAAKCHAVKMIAEVLCHEPEKFWDADAYRVTATDMDGLMLFSVEMYAVLAPAISSGASKA